MESKMESNLKNCFVCLNENKLCEIGVFTREDNSEDKKLEDDSDEIRCVDNQVQVIFLLKTLLEIPNDHCVSFIQEYGNPCSWIYCCDSCSVYVVKARRVFDDIRLLQKKFEKLRFEMKRAIAESKLSKDQRDESQSCPTEVVRSFVTKELNGGFNEAPIKIENNMENNAELESFDWSPVETNSESDNDDDYGAAKNNDTISKRTELKKEPNFIANLQEINDNDKIYSCDICGEEVKGQDNLNQHKMIHTPTENKIYECDVCKKRFFDYKYLSSHYRIHTDKSPFFCTLCGEEFLHAYDLNLHVRIHTEVKQYKCPVCAKPFTSLKNFNLHLKMHEDANKQIHTEKSNENGDIFGQEINEMDFPAGPSKNMPNMGTQCYNCDICLRTYSDSVEWSEHLKLHRSRTCDICKTTFTNLRQLEIHLRTHSPEEEPYKCKISLLTFGQPQLLTSHLKKEHEGVIQVYQCHICGNKFLKNCRLSRHVRDVHPQGKPFSCNICGNKYKSAHTLKEHRKSHTDTAESYTNASFVAKG